MDKSLVSQYHVWVSDNKSPRADREFQMPEQVDVTPAASPKRTWRRKLLFATIAVVAVLLLVMISDRVAGWLAPPQTASLLFPANSRIEHESCEFQVDVEISPAGIRDQVYAPGEPPESTYRIVAIGDSFTFGWGVPSENAWPNVLEQLLNQKLKTKPSPVVMKYEVLNFGLPGASPREYEASAAKAIEHFRPNLLIVGILQADDLIQSCEQQPPRIPLSARILDVFIPSFRRMFRESQPPTPMESYRKTFRLSQQYIRSQFTSEQKRRYNALSLQVQQFFEDGLLNPALVQRSITVPHHFELPMKSDEAWRSRAKERLSESLASIQKSCAARNCQMVVAIIPNGPYVSKSAAQGMQEVGYSVPESLLTTDVPDEIVRGVCKELSIPCYEQTAEFRQLKQDCYFPLDGHFNEIGHETFAKNLARSLTAILEP